MGNNIATTSGVANINGVDTPFLKDVTIVPDGDPLLTAAGIYFVPVAQDPDPEITTDVIVEH